MRARVAHAWGTGGVRSYGEVAAGVSTRPYALKLQVVFVDSSRTQHHVAALQFSRLFL